MFMNGTHVLEINPLDDPIITLPILLDVCAQFSLLVAIISQAITYAYSPRNDKMQRWYVLAIVILSATQTGFQLFKVIHVVILRMPWSQWGAYFLDVFLNGLLCSVCEIWLIRRCWRSLKNDARAQKFSKYILAVLVVLALTTFGVNLYMTIELAIRRIKGDVVADPLRSNRIPAIVFTFDYFVFASLVLDLIMSLILGWSIWGMRSGVDYLDRTLMRIHLFLWKSAILPWVSMLVAVGLYHARVQTQRNFVLLFLLMTGKLYVLGILLHLNSRKKHAGRMEEDTRRQGRTSLTGSPWDDEQRVGGVAGGAQGGGPAAPVYARSSQESVLSGATKVQAQAASDAQPSPKAGDDEKEFANDADAGASDVDVVDDGARTPDEEDITSWPFPRVPSVGKDAVRIYGAEDAASSYRTATSAEDSPSVGTASLPPSPTLPPPYGRYRMPTASVLDSFLASHAMLSPLPPPPPPPSMARQISEPRSAAQRPALGPGGRTRSYEAGMAHASGASALRSGAATPRARLVRRESEEGPVEEDGAAGARD